MLYERRANDAVTTRLSRANHALLDAINPYKTSILGRGGCGVKRAVVGLRRLRGEAGCCRTLECTATSGCSKQEKTLLKSSAKVQIKNDIRKNACHFL